MKILLHLSALLLLALPASLPAQEIRYDRVDFREAPEWSEVLSLARMTGKIIFLDGYTSWCRPCKKMDKEVFTRPKVANYFNQKFINVKYDMEKGEGVQLKKRFGVSAFPTYLFINSRGEVIHKILGAHTEGEDFLEHSKLADIAGRNYSDLQARYRNGERNSDLIFDYLKALRMAGEMDKEKGIVDDYLRLMTADHFMDKSYWGIVKAFLNDPASREFRILMENQTAIGEAIGRQEVDNKIYQILNGHVLKSMDLNNWPTINKEDDEKIIGYIKNMPIENRNELLSRALAAQHYRNGDYYDFVAVVNAMIDFDLLTGFENPHSLYLEYAHIVNKMVIDTKIRKKALRWIEIIDYKNLTAEDRTKYFKVKEALGGKL